MLLSGISPLAVDDSYSVNEDNSLNVNPPSGVLSNDFDAEGDSLTAVLVTGSSSGTLSLNPNGRFTYTPDADFAGIDSFTYMARASAHYG
jgi:hypothetical protein